MTLAPLDNHALANLCGPLDANLRQIEAALDVAIAHRGGTFTLDGPPAQTKLAEQALRRFYAHAGKTLSLDDIQLGLIELTTQRAAGSPAAAGEDEGTRLRSTWRSRTAPPHSHWTARPHRRNWRSRPCAASTPWPKNRCPLTTFSSG